MEKDRKFIFAMIFATFFLITTIIGFILYISANNKIKDVTDADVTIDSTNLPVERRIYDSVLFEYNNRIDSINNNYNIVVDSIEYYKNQYDSIYEELFVAQHKLERIREYNRIAAQGNNITFLRGWINRVLNE